MSRILVISFTSVETKRQVNKRMKNLFSLSLVVKNFTYK